MMIGPSIKLGGSIRKAGQNVRAFAALTFPVTDRYLPSGWTMANSIAILPLPKGWRWLGVGEWAEYGDFCHDPRCPEPTKVIAGGWLMTDQNHPVRTQRPKPGERAIDSIPTAPVRGVRKIQL